MIRLSLNLRVLGAMIGLLLFGFALGVGSSNALREEQTWMLYLQWEDVMRLTNKEGWQVSRIDCPGSEKLSSFCFVRIERSRLRLP